MFRREKFFCQFVRDLCKKCGNMLWKTRFMGRADTQGLNVWQCFLLYFLIISDILTPEDPIWPFGLYFIIANTLLNSFILATIDQTLTLAFNIHTVSIDSESTSTALVNPWLGTIHWCTIFEKICVWGIKDKTLSVMLILRMILKNCKVQNYWEKVQISAHIASD